MARGQRDLKLKKQVRMYLSLNIPNRLKELRNESIRKQFLDVAGDLGFRQLKKVILKSIKIRIRITK